MKKGFTLAEVLITLVIIGVVAAIMVPALLSNFEKHTWEAGIKKAYNSLSEAIELYMVEDGSSKLSSSSLANNQEGMRAFVNKYFKVVKDCGDRYYDPNGNSCFAKEYYSLDKSQKVNISGYKCMFVVNTADNMSFCFDSGAIPTSEAGSDINGDGVVDENDIAYSSWDENAEYKHVMSVEVDINGPKWPNVFGRDVFAMHVMDNGTVGDSTYDESKRDEILEKYQKNAWPMPIGIIQADGWKMTY